jgi:hypothetical protein
MTDSFLFPLTFGIVTLVLGIILGRMSKPATRMPEGYVRDGRRFVKAEKHG